MASFTTETAIEATIYAKRGAVEVGFLKLSAELEFELKSLGYAVTHIEHGVVVTWLS